MSFRTLISAGAWVALASLTAPAALAGTVSVFTNASSQGFTLYGQGPIAPGIGSFKIGQGSGSYDAGANLSTFTLSGTIAGGAPGWNSGTFAFITTYAGQDTPQAGPDAPPGQSNPSDTNEFFYDTLDPSTSMKLVLTGTPSGDHTIPLVKGGAFLGPSFSFAYVFSTCSGVAVCDQNTVGLTPGASESGPVIISAAFNVPEPATWAMLLVGLGGLGAAMRGRRQARAVGAP